MNGPPNGLQIAATKYPAILSWVLLAKEDIRRFLKPNPRMIPKQQKMEMVQTKLDAVEQKLADNTLYEDSAKDKLKALLLEQGDLKSELEQAEMDWFEASEALEEAEV